ncbi:MAG TPA: pyridoxal phosphate-dependent aminotransferase [Clostridiales bacterium]|nr:pyridoxal phosphate-dependent aminotransferase [Clostridiales bacterium]
MREIKKSTKLDHVCYDIRGPVLEEARRLEEEGHDIIKLNIGNPAPFGFDAPDEIIQDMIKNLTNAQGYCDSKGILTARRAIIGYCKNKGIQNVEVDDVYIGNGVSELIMMSMQGLLDNGDEVLIPAPDYPLWTAAVNLAGGRAVHYICDEQADWWPDIDDIKRKITDKTKGIVVINPNNPTGAVYSKDLLQQIMDIAAQHELIVFSDEIYDKILYDGVEHVSTASLRDDILCVTFNGLSKSHRIAGFRAGWMVLSGDKRCAKDYIEGLDILAGMRLCSNVPVQYAIQTAMDENESLKKFIGVGGRLKEQRDYCYKYLNDIPGISCVKPKGAFYVFPKIDTNRFNIKDDRQFILDLLLDQKVLLVQGTGFNWPRPDHFRIVFLPNLDELKTAIGRIAQFLSYYKQR